MYRANRARVVAHLALVSLILSGAWAVAPVGAQTNDSLAAKKQKADELVKQLKMTEALPLLEELSAAEPANAELQFQLGSALLAQAYITQDVAARKSMRIRARDVFIKSKALGVQEPVVDAMISAIPADGADARAFSQNRAANDLMNAAEALFAQGKLDDALTFYQQALEADAKLYEAALFSGDVYTQKSDYEQAEIWYQKAIAIDPNRETAYRYSATPLMRQGKTDQARDRYIEAFISEPYGQFGVAGLQQWGQVTKVPLGHPNIYIPSEVTFDAQGNANVKLDPALLAQADDGSPNWAVYGGTRTIWRKGKFAKTFPKEQSYRHSLAEEAEALRAVLSAAAADKRVKSLSPSLTRLKQLDDEGLLESYILLAKADEGIAADYPGYLQQNRAKLRRYVTDYVVNGGGK